MTPSPLFLDLTDRRVVLFGGGPSACARALGLRSQGARVLVVWPQVCQELARLVDTSDVTWLPEPPSPRHLDGTWLISLRTEDPDTDASITAWADERRIWCEGGTRAQVGPASQRAPEAATDTGHVVLVGGGPGDPELLTVRGWRELASADVIVTDRLAPLGILSEIAPGATIVDVGKQPYHHPIPQAEINELLATHARAGQRVVRLKGGDPFLLGRGGEEVLACREAGIPVTVVPGVTSAFAAPLAADIPVTHRGKSTGVLVISGHDELEPQLLATWAGTIVVLMGMSRLGELTAALIAAGKDFDTPAAVVAKAWTPEARSVRGRLGDIHARVLNAGLTNPAVIVIGSVVDVLHRLPNG